MFERRLKIFLAVLILITIGLLARTFQVQVFSHGYWQGQAAKMMVRPHFLETTRGCLLDFRGREIAADVACIDACVDYRAILHEPDDKWLSDQARARVRNRLGEAYKRTNNKQRAELLEDEKQGVRRDLELMWASLSARLAKISNKSQVEAADEIEQTRQDIIHRVEMRRRVIWYAKYQKAMASKKSADEGPAPLWRKWLAGGEGSDLPQVDSFADDVAEQREAHVILPAIDTETNNLLAKNLDRFPGLVLRPSTHRFYPYQDVGCHLIGHLARVDRNDIENDPNVGSDELRQYYPNDLIGRTGLESLAEPLLRGTRGRVDTVLGSSDADDDDEKVLDQHPPMAGGDVRCTIDIDLQKEITEAFRHVVVSPPGQPKQQFEMHGAAIVIDVPTGEVRAMVSYPTYDLNELDDHYATLMADEINQPLMNRATQAQLEPGSTVKPMVGLSAITAGVVGVHEGIECTGFLRIPMNGRLITLSTGRCWTASKFMKKYGFEAITHHRVPDKAPHRGVFGNADGFLVYADGLERSCNVYFETVADRLGIDRLSYWFDKFGLGRKTGVGIAESNGRLPNAYDGPAFERRSFGYSAGIGQGNVATTPIQMANVAATIARDGIWVRPHLLTDGREPPRTVRGIAVPDRVDLHLDPQAIADAHDGMTRVVNSLGGTGTELHREDVLIAGKTGTAQAAMFSIPARDKDGHVLRDDKGHVVKQFLKPITPDDPNPNPDIPGASPDRISWYRGSGAENKDLAHGWYIGFAPADHPQIAFAVLVEYGGSGGIAGASVARNVIESCIEHGYLANDKRKEEEKQAAELMHDVGAVAGAG